MIRTSVSAALLLALAGSAWAQDAQGEILKQERELREQIKQLEQQLVKARAEGLRSVTINGKTLPPDQVRREAVHLVGAKLVKLKMADFFIEEYKQKAIDGGRDKKDFEIPEEKIVKDLEGTVREFQIKNPGVEFWDAVRAITGLDKEGYLQQARQTELFNRVFFPGPAKSWPQITKEAIMASASGGGSGKDFWDNIEKSSVDDKGNPREMPPFWMQLCRQWVQKQLEKWSDIQFPSDGLAPEIVLKVNERTWATAAAFDQIRPALYVQDIEKAIGEVMVREVLKQELEKSGAYLSDEAFRKEFDTFRQEYDNTPFNTEVIAVAFKGYPSLEAYRQRWRLIKSYENLIAKDINDDNLKAHAEKYARFFADGNTSLDVIQVLGKDIKTSGWVPDGMERAKARAQAIFDEIKKGAPFDRTLESKGEFYQTDTEKGRLGSKSLNQLRQSLRESEFTDLLQGYSVGNYLFYEAEVGKVVGPLRGPEGYYIARVTARNPARSTPSIAEPRTRELVKQDYVTTRFLAWANEAMAKAKIE